MRAPTFQRLISHLHHFWAEHGCLLAEPYDLETGAGTFHPATFLRALGPEPWRVAYVQPSRRPTDGRYGQNPNRLQRYYQYQVLLKPAPSDAQALYLESLATIGISSAEHDLRFLHDDWEAPTLGAWGLGWEVRLDGLEITQFTYFQEVGGIPLQTIPVEITYGLERIAMYLQRVDSVFDLLWTDDLTYGELHRQSEVEFSAYNFDEADVEMLRTLFEYHEAECRRLLDKGLMLPAYDQCVKTSHLFNLLDARKAQSVTERIAAMARIRGLAKRCAQVYLKGRETRGFPLLGLARRRA